VRRRVDQTQYGIFMVESPDQRGLQVPAGLQSVPARGFGARADFADRLEAVLAS